MTSQRQDQISEHNSLRKHPVRMRNVSTKNSKCGFFKKTINLFDLDNPDEPIQRKTLPSYEVLKHKADPENCDFS